MYFTTSLFNVSLYVVKTYQVKYFVKYREVVKYLKIKIPCFRVFWARIFSFSA